MDLAERLSIVEAKEADIPGIARVLDGTLGQDFRYGSRSFEENVAYTFKRSLEHKHEGVYVAKEATPDGEEVVGFAWFMNHPPNNGTAILEMFAVRTDKQRQGIGSRLIVEAGDRFVASQQALGVNLRTLHLTTNYSNGGAITIYPRAGYKLAGQIDGFVGEGNVEVVMIKRVSDAPCPKEYMTKT